jgi:hypothetical protein
MVRKISSLEAKCAYTVGRVTPDAVAITSIEVLRQDHDRWVGQVCGEAVLVAPWFGTAGFAHPDRSGAGLLEHLRTDGRSAVDDDCHGCSFPASNFRPGCRG